MSADLASLASWRSRSRARPSASAPRVLVVHESTPHKLPPGVEQLPGVKIPIKAEVGLLFKPTAMWLAKLPQNIAREFRACFGDATDRSTIVDAMSCNQTCAFESAMVLLCGEQSKRCVLTLGQREP